MSVPSQAEIVTLVVDGYALTGWQSVEVERSMESGAIAFTLQATAASLSPQAMALRQGQDVEIYTTAGGGSFATGGGDLLCSGAIDDYDAEYEGADKTVTLTGRSAGRDPIDCPAVEHRTGRVENKTLVDAASEFGAELAAFFADDVQPATPSTPFTLYVEAVSAAIARAAGVGTFTLRVPAADQTFGAGGQMPVLGTIGYS